MRESAEMVEIAEMENDYYRSLYVHIGNLTPPLL